MLRALGYTKKSYTFLEAYESFKLRIFGLGRIITLDQMLDALDSTCESERVGKYEPVYMYDW